MILNKFIRRWVLEFSLFYISLALIILLIESMWFQLFLLIILFNLAFIIIYNEIVVLRKYRNLDTSIDNDVANQRYHVNYDVSDRYVVVHSDMIPYIRKLPSEHQASIIPTCYVPRTMRKGFTEDSAFVPEYVYSELVKLKRDDA